MLNEKMKEYGSSPSIIRELFEEAKNKKKLLGEDKVFDFTIGNPSIEPPKIVNETLTKLLKELDPISLHGYTSSTGDPETKKAIISYLNKTYNTSLSDEYIYLTMGAASGIKIALSALLNKGDEVIVFAPYFPEYKIYVESSEGVFHKVDTSPSFDIDFNKLEVEMNEKVKVVIINSPNNPTGVLYSEDTIKKLSNLLVRFEEKYNHPIYLLSDEPYRDLIYDDTLYPFITNYYDNSLVAYSFSKSLSLPGERIGYLVLSPKMRDVKDVFDSIKGAGRALGYVCQSSLFQKLIPHVLGHTSNINEYKENRNYLTRELKELGYEFAYPHGAFYLYLKALEDDAVKFANIAKEYNLYLVPSDSFGAKGYVRIAYCVKKDVIIKSIPAFKKLAQHYEALKWMI